MARKQTLTIPLSAAPPDATYGIGITDYPCRDIGAAGQHRGAQNRAGKDDGRSCVPVDVLVVSSREPGSTQLVEAVYEQVGLGQGRRASVEEPIVDAEGRRTGSERRLPPLSGL